MEFERNFKKICVYTYLNASWDSFSGGISFGSSSGLLYVTSSYVLLKWSWGFLRGGVQCAGSVLRNNDQVNSRMLLVYEVCADGFTLAKREVVVEFGEADVARFGEESASTTWTLRLSGTRPAALLSLWLLFSWRMSRLLRARSKKCTTCSISERWLYLGSRNIPKKGKIENKVIRSTISWMLYKPVSIAIVTCRPASGGKRCRSLRQVLDWPLKRPEVFDSPRPVTGIAEKTETRRDRLATNSSWFWLSKNLIFNSLLYTYEP